jgi:hydrogenase maturation protein HypF
VTAPVAGDRARVAWRIAVRGLVQGVGFRPFVHRLAQRHGLAGWVRNESDGVTIQAEGAPETLARFLEALRAEAPAPAEIAAVERVDATLEGSREFRVGPSTLLAQGRQPVAPDLALCAACERELLDPADRRFRYPFITCTTCGPRYTLIEGMPYDRARTTMRAFTPCAACEREYADPLNRRHHSQTNSCAECGPRLWLTSGSSDRPVAEGWSALREAAGMLRGGQIVALRGLGGFHLATDATSGQAVRRLRERKLREAKPLAVMVRDVAQARTLALVGDGEARLLQSAERPIVLLERLPGTPLAEGIAPGLHTVGVMTPYTPLHVLLLELTGRPLVMTSGNRADEPIATGNVEARERLAGIADAFLLHDREIVARYDDSVVRVVAEAPVVLRRARGYAPRPLPLPVPSPVPLVAVGPHLKHTFTLAQGREAYVSQHIGDLESLEALEHFRQSLATLRRLFRIEPVVAVRDRHPGYLSTRVAEELGLRTLVVQHHVAHVAAVLAEHGRTDPAIGVAFDGTGYGDDGHTWGAELFVASLTESRRVGQLRYAPMPGGDLAARSPWRAALGYQSLAPDGAPAFAAAFAGVPPTELALVRRQLASRVNAPLASSMGRLFDAAAAVLGIRREAAYEGQAPMELEALAGSRPARALPFTVTEEPDGLLVLDPLPLLAALDDRRGRGDDVADLAARFHETVADASAVLVEWVAADTGLRTAALSGGVFQNARLLAGVRRRLLALGLEVLTPHLLGPNDGAISYGQAAVAAALLARE